ncbi:EamA family transporter [Nocardioides sp. GY 10113]|nr:EamA family transporter [Nocardioides sp. GY 10113]
MGLVLLGIASVQLGAGVAKNLFDEVAPTTIVWLRLATSSLILVVLARPRLRGRSREEWWTVLGFGAALGTMNWAIYQSFSRIPIGVAVTFEFAGPLLLAAAGFRRGRDLAWVALAGLGVVLLGAEREGLDPVGVAFALLAGAAWAAYILLSARTGRLWPGLDGLAVASVVATLLIAPALATIGGGELSSTRILLLGAAVGLLSSVVPYSAELVALRRLPAATFGVLMSLEPAAAALVGLVVVGEDLQPAQWLAIGCVVAASIGATRAAAPGVPAAPAPD